MLLDYAFQATIKHVSVSGIRCFGERISIGEETIPTLGSSGGWEGTLNRFSGDQETATAARLWTEERGEKHSIGT